MTVNKELIGASTRLLILSVLAREASYGYAIIRAINREGEGLFTWQEGTVYPILHKLEKEGLVRTQWQEADTGRKRKYYYINAKGRKALSEGTREWTGFHKLIMALGDGNRG